MFKRSLLFAAFLAAVLTAQAAPPIIIIALPYSITAPGTYVLQSNLTDPVPNSTAIFISTTLSGPVVLDFKGHTITGPGLGTAPGFSSRGVVLEGGSNNLYPITIRNGTLSNFGIGVSAVGGEEIGKTDVTINSIVFNLVSLDVGGNPGNSFPSYGVLFQGALGCSVTNCTFNSVWDSIGIVTYGIADIDAMGPNTYNNNTFNNTWVPLTISLFFDEGIASLGINCQTSAAKTSLPKP